MNDAHLIKTYMDRFINQTTRWGKQWVDYRQSPPKAPYAHQEPDMYTKGGRYRYEPVSAALVSNMIEGRVSCAWAAIDDNGCSRWLCFDSDNSDGRLDRLELTCKSLGLYAIREGRRPGRDGHLWLLFDRPVRADLLIVLAKALMDRSGVSGLEIFPATAYGYSQVRAPLSINLKPEAKRARGLFDGGGTTPRSQFEWLAAQPLNSADHAIKLIQQWQPQATAKAKPVIRGAAVQFPANRRFHFNISDYVDLRRSGKGFVGQCPCCAREGHDLHQDNLHVTEGGLFCCMYGGPNAVHSVKQIIAVAISQRLRRTKAG